MSKQLKQLSRRVILPAAIIGIIVLLVLLFVKILMPFHPSTTIYDSPQWKTYSNKDAGYEFSYPSDFKFDSSSQFELGLTGSIDEASLSKIDESQKPYVFKGNHVPDWKPGETYTFKYYPEYYISLYVTTNDPYLNRAVSAMIPPKNNLSKIGDISIGGEKGSMYLDTSSSEGSTDRVTFVEANGYTYTIEYEARTRSLHTEDKYFPLYKQILSTIHFFHPTSEQKPTDRLN